MGEMCVCEVGGWGVRYAPARISNSMMGRGEGGGGGKRGWVGDGMHLYLSATPCWGRGREVVGWGGGGERYAPARISNSMMGSRGWGNGGEGGIHLHVSATPWWGRGVGGMGLGEWGGGGGG